MHKIYIILLAALLANHSISKASSPVDSIGVENNNGKKTIIHQVEAKETYYSLAKRYHVNYKDIMTFNDSKFLQIGVLVKVPTSIPFLAISEVASNTNVGGIIEYTIKAKDNLNLLAERYGTTVNEIKRINNLSSINLQIGQVLKIQTNSGSASETVPVVSVAQPLATPTPKLEQRNEIAVATHVVKPKEHLNLLAEKYGTTVEEIKRLNGLSSNNLSIGQVLKIPSTIAIAEETPVQQAQQTIVTQVPKVAPKPQVPVTTNSDGSFEHIVTSGETIYSIAKKYNLTTFQLKSFNNLSDSEVTVGQKLLIKGARSVNVVGEESTGNGNTLKDPSLRYAPSSYGLVQMEEKGTAVWISDQDLDPSKMLVLHRTAPIGTIIKVTNPMSNRSAFAKVVGKYTENESTKDVIIVMTKAVADAIGALDKRFFCNLTYGAQENEQ